MKKLLCALIVVTLAVGMSATPALASGPLGYCLTQGGTWSGPNSVTGTCTFFPEDGFFSTNCSDEDILFVQEFDSSALTTSYCVAAPQDRPESTEGEDEGETLSLGGGKNGSASFPPGSCPQQCTISGNLPASANQDLPGDALATLYVRVVDEGGGPGGGSYTVCFDNPSGAALTIYRYIGGSWTAIRSAAADPICVSASGDGAFYLGG